MKRHGALITPVRSYGARWGFDDYFTTGKRVQVRRATKIEAIQAHSDLSVLMANGRKDLATIKQTELAEFREWTKARESTVLIKTAVTQLLEEKRHDREAREKWLSILTHYLDRLADELVDQRMIDVTTTEYNSLLRSLRLSPRTWNNNRSAFIELERWAIKHRYLPPSHKQAGEIKRMKINPAELISYWRPSEFATILATANENDRLWYLLGGFAGIRTEELMPRYQDKDPLTWEDFNWHEHTIHLRQRTSKTGEARNVPISDQLAQWLQPYRQRTGPCLQIRYSVIVDRITRSTNIKNKRNANRHSYGIYRRAELRNLAQVADEMGTGIDRVRINYSRPSFQANSQRGNPFSHHRRINSPIPVTGKSQVFALIQRYPSFKIALDT
jgi:integrase